MNKKKSTPVKTAKINKEELKEFARRHPHEVVRIYDGDGIKLLRRGEKLAILIEKS